METNLLFKMVGNYSISQTEWKMGEDRPREDCQVCHNAKYATILVKQEEGYICIECLLEKGKVNRNHTAQTLLVKCSECNKFIDLGSKYLEIYNSPSDFLLNEKCPYCETLIAETDTWESDYRVLGL